VRRVRLREEQGIALTVAICSLALMITLGGIALNQAVNSLGQSKENTDAKRAHQAADAAIDAATYAVSRATLGDTLEIDPLHPETVVTQNCVVTVGQVAGVPLDHPDIDLVPLDPLTPAAPDGTKWCAESSESTTVDGATYSFRVSQLIRAGAGPCGTSSLINLDRYVVGVGRAGDAVRRVRADLKTSISLLSGAAVQSLDDFSMSGAAKVLGSVESNGNITGAVTNVISGNATYGKGKAATGVVVGGSKGEACQNFVIPDVDPGAVTKTANDNTSYTPTCVNSVTLLLLGCGLSPLVSGKADYNATDRTLTITGNGRATLTGHNYLYCNVTVKGNGVLMVPANNSYVRIFLDDPANCPGVAGAGQISVTEGGRIVNCHLQTQPETLQIYAVGGASATTQTFQGVNTLTSVLRSAVCGSPLAAILGDPMTIIAPRSTVLIGGSTAISGQVAAKQVTMSSSGSVNPISALINLSRLGSNPILPLYKPTDYVECTGRDFDQLPAANPSQGC
jgi:type II secretory pathway pseudopilin PulG